MKALTTRERVMELLAYDPETGIFTWKLRCGTAKIGNRAGCINKLGYRVIRLNGQLYTAHRLVWLVVHGTWPCSDTDHINGVKDDNRIANLREATRAENACNSSQRINNTSGYKGVGYRKDINKFRARCYDRDGNERHLGHFSTAIEAARAYDDFARIEHGEFARLNFPDKEIA